MAVVVLGLGSNCGDRLGYLRNTIHRIQYELALNTVEIVSISPIYESDALLPPDAPTAWNQPFLNANILCKTKLGPLELLHLIKGIEAQMGRKDRGRWAPREIDIDILVMGDEGDLGNKADFNFTHETLQIPHPSLLDRPFALLPLADLVPNWVISLPGAYQGMSAEQFAKRWKRNWESIPFRTRRSPLCFSELVGILNITPDSFSDGGLHNEAKASLEQTRKLIQNGINVVDIGAESTRPGARLLETEEEWSRLQPLLLAIQAEREDLSLCQPRELPSTEAYGEGLDFPRLGPIRLSVDTRNPEIASRALRLGVSWINDVSGFGSDSMKEVLAASPCQTTKAVVMHSLSVPPKKGETLSPDADLIDQLVEWAENRIQSLMQFGIDRNRIVFDPGLGFGKTSQQSWEILRRAHELHRLRVPILIGHSRKSFLTTLTEKPPHDRDIETILLSTSLVKKGISYLRVHNGEQNARALRAWAQVDGLCQW